MESLRDIFERNAVILGEFPVAAHYRLLAGLCGTQGEHAVISRIEADYAAGLDFGAFAVGLLSDASAMGWRAAADADDDRVASLVAGYAASAAAAWSSVNERYLASHPEERVGGQ
jgi:hypothetical protein